MKNRIITSIIVLVIGFTLNAQDISKNALGLRLGDSDGFGAELSYQRDLSKNNRLEFDLGWRDGKNYDGFKLAGLYQWVWNIDSGFNWYAGFGGGIGSYSLIIIMVMILKTLLCLQQEILVLNIILIFRYYFH